MKLLEEVLQEILTTVQAIQTDVSQLKTDVKSLDIRVGNLEKNQIELIEICRSIRDRQEETDAKVYKELLISYQRKPC